MEMTSQRNFAIPDTKFIKYIGDITWLRGDMKFIFEC